MEIQNQIAAHLTETPQTAEELATAMDTEEEVETVYLLCEHLVANQRAVGETGKIPSESRFKNI